MSNVKDIEILLFVKKKELTNSTTQEKFTAEIYDGYALYKGMPVKRVRGKRMKDQTYNTKDTGKPFTIKKAYLNFYDGEDLDIDLKDEGTLYIRLDEKINRSKGNSFIAATSEDLFYSKEDPRNTKGFRLGNLQVPLNGIVESYPTIDQWGDEAQRLRLSADSKYSLNLITKDMFAENKVGYVAQTSDELFTQEELEGLAKQFKFFERFNNAFKGEVTKKADSTKEKVVPATF